MSDCSLHLDFETRSALELPEVGLHNYATEPSTEVVLMAYAFGDRKVQVWAPRKDPEMPKDVREALDDPFVVKKAWNSAFERSILKFVLGIDVPIWEFDDPMVNARYLSLPGYLEDVSTILKLDQDEAKMSEGGRLIKLFCTAVIRAGEQTLFGVTENAYHDWNTHPTEWALFEEYVKRDVISERANSKKLAKYPLPQSERRAWWVDQRINERGIPCNLDLVRGAQFIAEKEAAHLKAKLKDLTGLENPNSNDQMLAWVQGQGYPFSSLGKPFVARAMSGEGSLTPEAREVLEIRRMTSKTSVNKFQAILAAVSSDGRLRHQFSFLGAQRTGRWSGKSATGTGVQMQNLSKPSKAVEKNMDRAIALVQKMDYNALVTEFGQPLEVVSSIIRASFQAEPGMKLLICDLSSIENRVLGWLSGCAAMLRVYALGLDPYLDFAASMYNQSYEELLAEFKSGNKTKRNNGKAPVLGCGYQLGGGEEIVTDSGDRIKTGLLGYAAQLGVEMTQEEAAKAVTVFREKYKEVVDYWYALERASIAAVRGHGPQTVGFITFEATGKSMLRILLPSGRHLTYLEPKVEDVEFTTKDKETGKDRTFKKEQLSYMGVDQQTRQWVRQHTRGGHITENLCQAVARDILLNGILLAEENDMPVVAHVHDEIVAMVPDNGTKTVQDLVECMRTVPSWATGLPLDAAGFESRYYRKD